MKNMLLIINPRSGQKKANRLLVDIVDIFNRASFSVITHVTSGVGDAQAACLRYADQVDVIVCCGGDGTFNETVSGLIKSGKDLPIGYIPAGSTNDFATSLHLSNDIYPNQLFNPTEYEKCTWSCRLRVKQHPRVFTDSRSSVAFHIV